MNDSEEIAPRKQICEEFRISPSTERRMRQEEPDWPPHLRIGRKIFYRREGVRQWLARREASAGVANAPAFTPEQATWLQTVFSQSTASTQSSSREEEVA